MVNRVIVTFVTFGRISNLSSQFLFIPHRTPLDLVITIAHISFSVSFFNHGDHWDWEWIQEEKGVHHRSRYEWPRCNQVFTKSEYGSHSIRSKKKKMFKNLTRVSIDYNVDFHVHVQG